MKNPPASLLYFDVPDENTWRTYEFTGENSNGVPLWVDTSRYDEINDKVN